MGADDLELDVMRPQRSPGLMAGEGHNQQPMPKPIAWPQRSPGLMAGEGGSCSVVQRMAANAATEPRPDGRGGPPSRRKM